VKRVLEMRKALTVAFVVFLLCVSAGSVRAYTNNENFFSFEEPSGWTANESVGGNVVVVFSEPTSNNESIALIEIDVETITSSMTLEELATTVKDQYQTLFNSSYVISESGGVVNGVDAYEIFAAITMQRYDLMLRQVMMIRNMRIYIVSYVATTDRYQQFLPDFEDSIETFTIIDPIPPYFWYVFIGAIIAAVAAIAAGLYIYKRRANTPIVSY
jgi:hypothetical protein